MIAENERRAATPRGRGPSLCSFPYRCDRAPPVVVRLAWARALRPLFGASFAGSVARWILRFQPPSFVRRSVPNRYLNCSATNVGTQGGKGPLTATSGRRSVRHEQPALAWLGDDSVDDRRQDRAVRPAPPPIADLGAVGRRVIAGVRAPSGVERDSARASRCTSSSVRPCASRSPTSRHEPSLPAARAIQVFRLREHARAAAWARSDPCSEIEGEYCLLVGVHGVVRQQRSQLRIDVRRCGFALARGAGDGVGRNSIGRCGAGSVFGPLPACGPGDPTPFGPGLGAAPRVFATAATAVGARTGDARRAGRVAPTHEPPARATCSARRWHEPRPEPRSARRSGDRARDLARRCGAAVGAAGFGERAGEGDGRGRRRRASRSAVTLSATATGATVGTLDGAAGHSVARLHLVHVLRRLRIGLGALLRQSGAGSAARSAPRALTRDDSAEAAAFAAARSAACAPARCAARVRSAVRRARRRADWRSTAE